MHAVVIVYVCVCVCVAKGHLCAIDNPEIYGFKMLKQPNRRVGFSINRAMLCLLSTQSAICISCICVCGVTCECNLYIYDRCMSL